MEVCQTGFEEEAELLWKEDQVAALAPCGEIKHVFARTARDCPEVTFLALEVRTGCGSILTDACIVNEYIYIYIYGVMDTDVDNSGFSFCSRAGVAGVVMFYKSSITEGG